MTGPMKMGGKVIPTKQISISTKSGRRTGLNGKAVNYSDVENSKPKYNNSPITKSNRKKTTGQNNRT